MAFINAGNYLLSRTRVGRALLSAAFELGVVFDFFRIKNSVKGNVNVKIKVKINVNGCGQECPLHTVKTGQIECLGVTYSMRGLRFESTMPGPSSLAHGYDYRRRLPHYQKAGRAIFVTFRKLNREQFAASARDAILRHCLHDDGKRYILHAATVMPDHVHLLLTPICDQEGWPYALPTILKLIKGVSARSVNKLLDGSGPVWQDESFDHVLRCDESFAEKLDYIRQNPVRAGLVKAAEDYPWLWVVEKESNSAQTSKAADRSVRSTHEHKSGKGHAHF